MGPHPADLQITETWIVTATGPDGRRWVWIERAYSARGAVVQIGEKISSGQDTRVGEHGADCSDRPAVR